MALKALLTTLFIVTEIIVFFGIGVRIDGLLKKYERSFTELGLIFMALIMSILFIGFMFSFIFYLSF